MKIYKFLIDHETRVEQTLPDGNIFVWTSCLGVALANSVEEAKALLWEQHLQAEALPDWLDLCEVQEILLDSPVCLAISQG